MTVPVSPATVTLTVPVSPAPHHHQMLLRRAQLQTRVQKEFWDHVRSSLGAADPGQTWPQPRVLLPIIADGLYDLVDPDDQDGHAYIDATLSLEAAWLRRLPARVDWNALQPESSAEQVSVPFPPSVIGRDTLLLPGLDLEVGFYALPQPFRSVLLHAGAEQLQESWAQLQRDFSTWDREWGDVSATVARQFQLHAEQAGRWCPGPAGGPDVIPVPGVKLVGAVLHRRPDRLGDCRWTCDLSFSLIPDAVRTWFPTASIDAPVGIDPGLMHPLTWASAAGTGKSLDPALIDLAGFPGGGERVVRQAAWERHAAGYDRVWTEVLKHRVIRVEDTHWGTLAIEDSPFPDRARDNSLWTWIDHLVALAPLTGSSIEWIPSKDTSTACSECGHVNAERQQLTFRCTSPEPCFYTSAVDVNAALNVAQAMLPRRALVARGAALRQPA